MENIQEKRIKNVSGTNMNYKLEKTRAKTKIHQE